MSEPTVHDSLEVDLQHLWEAAQPEIARRLGVIEQCLDVWLDGRLDPSLLQAAQREAHRLTGSLGVLGMGGATEVARQLDRALQSATATARADPAIAILAALHGEIVPGARVSDSAMPELVARGPNRSGRILLADDDQTVATAVRVALGLDGFELLWAREGSEAIRMAGEQELDLILLDLDLPTLRGLEVCRALRAQPRFATIPIMLITGHADPRQASGDRADAPCFTTYLAKPFTMNELRQHVRLLLHSAPSPALS